MSVVYKAGDPPGGTRLVTVPDDHQLLTAHRETDARSAMTRALAEYLHSLEYTINGQTMRFSAVFADWAEPEVDAAYPAAFVFVQGGTEYDAVRFTPQTPHDELEGYPGAYLVTPCEITQTLVLEVYCNGILERRQIAAMLEDALFPVSWMYGFRLELPFYHGARVSFEPTSIEHTDSMDDAKRRIRKTTVSLRASAPVYRLFTGIQKVGDRIRLSLETTVGNPTYATGVASPATADVPE